MSGITLTEVDDATIATPASGKATLFLDDTLGPAYKDDTGTVTPLEGAPGDDAELTYLDHGNTGAGENIDFSAATIHRLVLNAATVTLTTSNEPASGTPGIVRLLLVQDGTGGRVVSWPGDVSFGAAGAPTLQTAAGAIDVIDLQTVDGGTTIIGDYAGAGTATHIADTAGAHEASAISFDATGLSNTSATDVQEAIEDLDGAIGGAGGIPAGTSFPGSPSSNDLFDRTDLGMLFYYDGTRWLSKQVFTSQIRWFASAASQSFSATITEPHRAAAPGLQGGSDIWFVSHLTQFFVIGGTALSGSHKWVGTFGKSIAAGTVTNVSTINIDSGASSAWRTITTAIGALMNNGTSHFQVSTTWTKTGTPGNLQVHEELTYRIVAT